MARTPNRKTSAPPGGPQGTSEGAAKDPLAAELAALRADLARLAADFRALLKEGAAIGAEGAKALGETSRDAANQRLAAARDEVEAYAREKPAKALGFAALAGFLLGLLLSRR